MQKIQLNNKHLDVIALALRDKTSCITLEGTVRSSKTVVAIQMFYYHVKFSKENLHCIAAKDYNAIRDNLLDCNGLGFCSGNFRDVKMKKNRIGGYYLAVDGYDGKEKRILLAGYSNKETWKNILGKTIDTFLIDEANTANKTFIDETFSRQLSVDKPLTIFTLNGDDPKHFIYTDYINHAKPLFKVPASILHDMNQEEQKKAGWYYTHWVMEDNPAMTPEKIERAKGVYPIGSYYYTIKILGERGCAEGLIYELFVKNMKDYIIYDLKPYNITQIIMGVDFGGNGSAHTFVATGYVGTDYIIHLESERIDAKGMTPDQLASKFEEFSRMIIKKYNWYGKAIPCYVDSAEQTLKNGLTNKVVAVGLPIAVKNAQKRMIQDRIAFQQMLLSLKMLKFNAEAKSCIEAYRTARWNPKEGHRSERLDDGSSDIDTMDASEYTLEPLMKPIMQTIEFKMR